MANAGGVGDVAGTDSERIELIEAALDAIGAEDSTDHARLLAILALQLGSFAGRGVAAVLRPRRRGRGHGEAEPATAATLSFVLHCHSDATWVPHTLARRLANNAENVELARGRR